MKTRNEFIDSYRHEIGGMILDALEARKGPEMSLFIRMILRRVDVILAKMYGDLIPPPPLERNPNGQARTDTALEARRAPAPQTGS